MGWFGKKKKKGTEKTGDSRSRAEIMEEAMQNMKQAREEIGDDNLQKMAQQLMKDGFQPPPGSSEIMKMPKKSKGLLAKEKIKTMDEGKVADNLKILLEEK